MTREKLAAWATRNGRTLIGKAEYDELCGHMATAIIASTDLDRAFENLIETDH